MATTAYSELKTTDEPLRRSSYERISWCANVLAIVVGCWNVFVYANPISMIITAFYCINIYVLLGDYTRWAKMQKIILYSLLALIAIDFVIFLIEYYFVYKAGYYDEKREGEYIAFYMMWGSFLFELAFLTTAFLSTYYLYPDQLSLLSQEHPAAQVIEQNIKKQEEVRKSNPKRTPKMFDLENDDQEITAVITKSSPEQKTDTSKNVVTDTLQKLPQQIAVSAAKSVLEAKVPAVKVLSPVIDAVVNKDPKDDITNVAKTAVKNIPEVKVISPIAETIINNGTKEEILNGAKQAAENYSPKMKVVAPVADVILKNGSKEEVIKEAKIAAETLVPEAKMIEKAADKIMAVTKNENVNLPSIPKF